MIVIILFQQKKIKNNSALDMMNTDMVWLFRFTFNSFRCLANVQILQTYHLNCCIVLA